MTSKPYTPRGSYPKLSNIATFLFLSWICLFTSCHKKEVGSAEIRNAAQSGDSAKVEALLRTNPNLVFSKDQKGITPLHWATVKGHVDVARLLIAQHAEVNAKTDKGTTPLHWAAMKDYKDIAELLVAHGADVNAKADKGITPLHWAVLNDHTDMVQLLLTHGADVNSRDDLARHFCTSRQTKVSLMQRSCCWRTRPI